MVHLPSLASSYEMPRECITEFQRDGCTILRHLCSRREIQAYRKVIADAVGQRSFGISPLNERDTYGKAFIQVENLWLDVDAIQGFSLSSRFGRAVPQLLGVKKVRLYHDQALFKEPGGGHTPWHSDQGYWPLDGWGTAVLWMPLADVSMAMGAA